MRNSLVIASLLVVSCSRPPSPPVLLLSTSEGSCSDAPADACAAHAPVAFDHPPALGDDATCVVMSRPFVVNEQTTTSTYQGKTYAFCCEGCKQQFDADPPKYAQAR